MFLGIDIGTSFIKGAQLDVKAGCLRAVRRQPFPAPVSGLPSGFVEIEPEAVLAAARRLVDELANAEDPCEGILVCGQMGGAVLVTPTGHVLSNYMSWRDQRVLQPNPRGTESDYDVFRRALGDVGARDVGNELRPGYTPCLLAWLAARQQLPKDAIPVTIVGYVASALAGASPVEDPSQALGGLCLARGDWHRELFSQMGLEGVAWPPLAHLKSLGTCQLKHGRAACYPGLGDQQCALLGARLQPGELSLNISTGSQVSQLTETPEPGPYQLRPFFDGWWLKTLTHLPAGRALDVLLSLLTELARVGGHTPSDPWSYLLRSAERATDDPLEVDLAFFSGPMGERGSIANIGVENLTAGHLYRAAFRNMARNYRACAERLAPQCDWSGVVLSGGLANKVSLLQQFLREEFPGPLRMCPDAEDTFTGLLAIATYLAGDADSVLAAAQVVQSRQGTA